MTSVCATGGHGAEELLPAMTIPAILRRLVKGYLVLAIAVLGACQATEPTLSPIDINDQAQESMTLPQNAAPPVAADPTTTVVADPVTFDADVAFIGFHLDTFFESGDFELAIAQFGSNPREGDGTNVSEILYQAAIDAQVTVTDCTLLDQPRFYECSVTYSNMLFEAVDEAPIVTTLQFEIIRDGLIRTFGEQYPGFNPVSASWLVFERETGLADGSSCKSWGSNSISCPELQRGHIDEFAAWWANTRSG